MGASCAGSARPSWSASQARVERRLRRGRVLSQAERGMAGLLDAVDKHMDTCRLHFRRLPGRRPHFIRRGSAMDQRNTVRRAAIAASVALLAACQDTPTPFAPAAPQEPAALARSQQAQDRLEALFQATSPEVMAIPGTVFADNDEVAGRLVFGVEHIGAIRGVQNVLARHGVAASDY